MSTQTNSSERPKRLLRIDQVCERVGMSTTTIYQRIKDGQFPRQVKLGTLVAWVEQEIDDWIAERIADRDAEFNSRLDTPKAA